MNIYLIFVERFVATALGPPGSDLVTGRYTNPGLEPGRSLER